MECHIHIDESAGTATVRMSGLVTVDGLSEAFESLVSHPEFHEGLNRLWDGREADFSTLTPSDFKAIAAAAKARPSGPGVRAAFLVSRDVDFGVGRMYGSMEGEQLPGELRIFRDPTAAQSWCRKS